MSRVRLFEQAFVTLDANGNGTARLGPISHREVWYPGDVHVSANNSPVQEATCAVYVGTTADQQNFRDSTPVGSSGDTTDKASNKPVKLGEFIWAVWSNGDAGVRACVSVTGTKEV